MTRVLVLSALLAATGCGSVEGGPPWFVQGTARLPDCQDPPAFDLDGTTWFDEGTVTITSAGCDRPAGTEADACGLAWIATQDGADVEIIVDGEYRILGRACGDQLHLEGGWWLAIEDAAGSCDYEDGIEVGIDQGGATLAYDGAEMSGVLAISEGCSATYDVTLHRGP